MLYSREREKNVEQEPRLQLNAADKEAIMALTSGVERVDPRLPELETVNNDVIRTLENGQVLNRIIRGQQGEVLGYVACEEFVPHEAYIKYFATTGETGRDLATEMPAFFDYALEHGFTKLNFHGWNKRLNDILVERFGFKLISTDRQGSLRAHFYEKDLGEEQADEEAANKKRELVPERLAAFEQKYLLKLGQDYQNTLLQFSGKVDKETGKVLRVEKERQITAGWQELQSKLKNELRRILTPVEQTVLKLKIARHFQNHDSLSLASTVDALIESPKFMETDEGSLARLEEIHQIKSLEKIAELKKKKAEQTGGEGFNPYEAMFTTVSGKYYLARLLNMPHLEQESAYMNHCVGTSDSYINKIKRGDVEILSLRSIGQYDEVTGRYGEDKPAMTIEYNVRTGVIEQMKQASDAFLRTDDVIYLDVLDALSQLRDSELDNGKKRQVKRVEASETEHIEVKPGSVLTDIGEIKLSELDIASKPLILKVGKYEVKGYDTGEEYLSRLLYAVKGIECRPEEIARDLSKINEKTKVYLGQVAITWRNPETGKEELAPESRGIFQRLPKGLERIYTNFPEGEIVFENDVIYGGKTPEVMRKELVVDGVEITKWAGDILDKLPKITKQRSANVVKSSVAALGYPQGERRDVIYARAMELGLFEVAAQLGPAMRLNDKDQVVGDWYLMGMPPVLGSDGIPRVFDVGRDGDGVRGLGASDGRAGNEWYGGSVWAFAR